MYYGVSNSDEKLYMYVSLNANRNIHVITLLLSVKVPKIQQLKELKNTDFDHRAVIWLVKELPVTEVNKFTVPNAIIHIFISP